MLSETAVATILKGFCEHTARKFPAPTAAETLLATFAQRKFPLQMHLGNAPLNSQPGNSHHIIVSRKRGPAAPVPGHARLGPILRCRHGHQQPGCGGHAGPHPGAGGPEAGPPRVRGCAHGRMALFFGHFTVRTTVPQCRSSCAVPVCALGILVHTVQHRAPCVVIRLSCAPRASVSVLEVHIFI